MECSGRCRDCSRYYKVLNFDERKNRAYCPDCHKELSIKYKSLETVKEKLALFPKEVGELPAIVE